PLALIGLCALVPAGIIILIRSHQTRGKKNPLNFELLRSPGQSLKERIEEINDRISDYLTFMFMGPLAMYAIVVSQYLTSTPPSPFLLILYLGVALGLSVFFSLKIFRLMRTRTHYRLGYDCELMVGQGLHTLLAEGFRVFHDFPADGFNIDHIAIGPTGVFAIETKGRAKSSTVENRNWEVRYDGRQLAFPGWTETRPITQAVDQAKWLRTWLCQTTGNETPVEPVLAVPGWYIKRTGPGGPRAYNGKSPNFLAKGAQVLPAERIRAIAFQVEQQCRTVATTAYQTDTGKK
nr:NERD domain-containing protein [Desulfobulbus sp.]